MTGRFTIGDQRPGRFHNQQGGSEKHTHLLFETDAGANDRVQTTRARFGYMDLLPTATLSEHPWFKGLGPEPLGEDFNPKMLAAALNGRKQNIKVTLLDQRVVAGLGNIYVCEAPLSRRRGPPPRGRRAEAEGDRQTGRGGEGGAD